MTFLAATFSTDTSLKQISTLSCQRPQMLWGSKVCPVQQMPPQGMEATRVALLRCHFLLLSSPGRQTTTAMSSVFKRDCGTDESIRCSSWAWKIEHAEANVSLFAVMHIRDTRTILGNGIATEKKFWFKENMEGKKWEAIVHVLLFISFITNARLEGYRLLRFLDHTFFCSSLESETMGLRCIVFLNFGKLAAAASNNQRQGITKWNPYTYTWNAITYAACMRAKKITDSCSLVVAHRDNVVCQQFICTQDQKRA